MTRAKSRRAPKGSLREVDERELFRDMTRRRLRLSQYDLAAMWGCSQPFVSQLFSARDEERSLEKEEDFARMAGLPYEALWPAHPDRAEDPERRRAIETRHFGKPLS